MRALRLLLLTLLVWCSRSAIAEAETWSTTTSDDGTHFIVRLHDPHLVRRVPLVDGVRWDFAVSNRVRNRVSKELASGPVSNISIMQERSYVRIVARWRFPYAMHPQISANRFDLFIPAEITRVAVSPLASGVRLQRILRWTLAGPQAINVLYADLNHSTLRPELARTGQGFGMEPVSHIARRVHALAAVNGSFFSPKGGAPVGLLMLDGQIVSSSFYNRSVFGIRYDGSCFIDNARMHAAVRVNDDQVFLANGVNRPAQRNQLILYTPHWGARTHTVPDPSRREYVIGGDGTVTAANLGNAVIPRDGYVLSVQGQALPALMQHLKVGGRAIVYSQLSNEWKGVKYAIGGGPTLVSDGQVRVTAQEERFGAEIARGRAPRTAIGYRGGGQIVIVTVDGRQKTSVGMTLYELARLMRELGARESINLDGGGSTTMVVRGSLINRPSDGVERAVNNALVLFGAS